jgi:hypothetical protein
MLKSSTFIWNRWFESETMPTKSVSMVKLANFPVFSTKIQKNQLLQKKCRNSPWTNFHHLGKKKCSLKSHQIVSNDDRRRKQKKNNIFWRQGSYHCAGPHCSWTETENKRSLSRFGKSFLPTSIRSIPPGIQFALLLIKLASISGDSWSKMIRHDHKLDQTRSDMIWNYCLRWTAITNFDQTWPADLAGRFGRQTWPADLIRQGLQKTVLKRQGRLISFDCASLQQ